jgi:hypothetical protein
MPSAADLVPMKRWNLHICSPWSDDCAMDSVRLNIRTPWRFIIIALTAQGAVFGRDGKAHRIDIKPVRRNRPDRIDGGGPSTPGRRLI